MSFTHFLNRAAISAFAALFAVSCVANDIDSDELTSSYVEDWADSDFAGAGKVSALIPWSDAIELGNSVSGNIDENIRLFHLDLQSGDRVVGSLEVLDGDLSPHFTLAKEGGALRSLSTFWSEEALDKEYSVTETGSYVVIVRAYRDAGAGDFRFTLSGEREGTRE